MNILSDTTSKRNEPGAFAPSAPPSAAPTGRSNSVSPHERLQLLHLKPIESTDPNTEQLSIRIHGDASLATLVYLPGIHGDWTLASSFRERMKPRFRVVEFTYPRTMAWTLGEYASAVLSALERNQIWEGAIIGESFSSQVAWALLDICERGNYIAPTPGRERSFRPTALILAGGFVRYPAMPLIDLALWLWPYVPGGAIRLFLNAYALAARWRHRHAPETKAAVREFIERRTPEDLAAMRHRLKLIRDYDPTEIARRIKLPVFQLAGLFDPIVYFPAVRRDLERHCPGYMESKLIRPGDHNVLGTAPNRAAVQVTEWMAQVTGQP